MKKVLVYTRPDGGVSVVSPIIDDMERVRSKLPTDATEIHECLASEVPENRTFREAWKQNSGKIEINMPKACEIKTDQIRAERNNRLADDDVAYIRADEQGDEPEKAKIGARKQKLRDMPADIQRTISKIATSEQLEDWQPQWPD